MTEEGEWPRKYVHHHYIHAIEEQLMADITKLKEEVTALTASVETAVTELGTLKSEAGEVEELKKKIAELEAAGGSSTPSQAEVDEVTTAVEADKAKLDAAGA